MGSLIRCRNSIINYNDCINELVNYQTYNENILLIQSLIIYFAKVNAALIEEKLIIILTINDTQVCVNVSVISTVPLIVDSISTFVIID